MRVVDLGLGVLLCAGLLQISCFEDENEVTVIGSCQTERANEPGIIEHCQEYFERRGHRDAEAEYCAQTGSTWRDEPCPADISCGHCIEARSTLTLTTFWYPRADDPVSEVFLQESCEDPELDNTWVDNPEVSCE